MIDFTKINPAIDKKIVRRILKNKTVYYKFQDFNNNLDYFGNISKEDYIIYIVNYENKMLLSTNLGNIEFHLIRIYEDFLKEYAINEPYILFHNPMIDYVNEINMIDGSIKLNNFNNYINSFLRRFPECDDHLNDYKNLIYKGNISNENFKKFVTYYNTIGNYTEPIYNYVFNKIMELNYDLEETDYIELIKNFTKFVCSDLGFDDINVNVGNLEDGTTATYTKENKCILYDKKVLKLDYVFYNLVNLFHEVYHAYQLNNNHLYDYNKIKNAKDDLLRMKYGEQYYNENYWYLSLESDARCASYICLKKYLAVVAPNALKMKMHQLQDEINGNLADRENNFRSDFKNIYTLDELFSNLMKTNPEIVNNSEYRDIIYLEYHQDNTRKTILEIFIEKYQCLTDLNSVSIGNDEELNHIHSKMNFYDDLLNYSDYTLEELKNNYVLLDKYQTDNRQMYEEIFYYKNNILDKIKELENINSYLMSNESEVIIHGRNK